MALLSIENAAVTYNNDDRPVFAVRDVSFDVEAGRSVGIVGESGSGKSTLIHAVLRILNPKTTNVTGRITFDGEDILTMNEDRLAKLRWNELAVVFQKSMNALSPVHRVGSFMTDVYRVHEPGATKSQAMARVTELLGMVNLPPRVATLYPHELSGGMMQRVSIALSLLHDPRLLILDEATTALDVITQTQILGELKQLEQKLNLTCIMVTHDMSVVASACEEAAILYGGKLVEFGPVITTLVTPAHPYTKCLLESFPDMVIDAGKQLQSIPGSLPDMRKPPGGCIFAPRCPKAMVICASIPPVNIQVGERHYAACHLLAREGGSDE